MTSSELSITNLLFRYAELIDSGRLERMEEELFAHTRFVLAPPPAEPIDGPAMIRLLERLVVIHDDGTPMTRHVITNPIVHIDEEEGTAECRSYYTVMQKTETLPLQAVAAGRYHDRFERHDGSWRFAQRDYSMLDMVGDVSQHLNGWQP